MRSDFNRVLTEDPRYGSRTKFREYRRAKENAVFDEEFSGGKESMMARRRAAKGSRKTFGDHLSPLRRWVEKQVGRRWDDVYSEVCELFDRRSQIKDHVHVHLLRDFVELNTRMIDGEVRVFSRWDGWIAPETRWRRQRFYVHPVTGVLCGTHKENEPGHAKRKAEERAAAQHAIFRVHSKDEHLHFEDGQWWVYRMADVPERRIEYRCPTWWTNAERERWETMTLAEREREGQPVWVRDRYDPISAQRNTCPNDKYYVEKRVANRKILKAHGLDGTAEFKERSRSHREMSKYR